MHKLHRYNIVSYNINGVEYVTSTEFARITSRSVSSVRQLMSRGNSIRKMRCFKIEDKVFIPLTEMFNYPFPMAGRGHVNIAMYYVDDEGKLQMKATTLQEMRDARE